VIVREKFAVQVPFKKLIDAVECAARPAASDDDIVPMDLDQKLFLTKLFRRVFRSPRADPKNVLLNRLIIGNGQFRLQRLLKKCAKFLRGILLARVCIRRDENSPRFERIPRSGRLSSAYCSQAQHCSCQ